ncbi:MAG: hypothetical protein ABJN65_12075 [Parasphingorhabdus sp.]
MFVKTLKLVTLSTILATAMPGQAQEMSGNKTLGSASDVWRIEMRNLERFLAMTSGDSDGVSEVRSVKISLVGPDRQFHSVTEVNPFLSINGGPRSRDNSIDVRVGDRVFLERLEPGKMDTYNMWIHAKERPQGDLGDPVLNFEIKVATRELDCAGDRVCKRGSTGVITYYVSLPRPTAKYNRCNAQNTYRISAVNGASMQLQPLNRRAPRGVVNVRHETSGGHVASFGAKGVNQGVELAMQSGEICIASTSR